ncbi:hypothetical protein CEXT_212291 [Caerostris extrusa]|uniref:Transmembrane protein n=1 Tax=Caerostris extrusa TaxID=172846 RepID=A0AAV4WTL8_CAEEX|nr:hypothetical protein CEXT_212291 [Caerostris extrusa]
MAATNKTSSKKIRIAKLEAPSFRKKHSDPFCFGSSITCCSLVWVCLSTIVFAPREGEGRQTFICGFFGGLLMQKCVSRNEINEIKMMV